MLSRAARCIAATKFARLVLKGRLIALYRIGKSLTCWSKPPFRRVGDFIGKVKEIKAPGRGRILCRDRDRFRCSASDLGRA